MFILTVYTPETGAGNFSTTFENQTDLLKLVNEIRTRGENRGDLAYLEWPADPNVPANKSFLNCAKVVSYTITTE